MNQHPKPERLRQWLDGRLNETEAQEIYAHVTKCPDVCTTVLDRIQKGEATASDSGMMTLTPGARPLPDYELIRQRGVGGFGEVWQARGPGGFDVALKFVRLDARGSENDLRSLEIMKSIRHPNLVGLFGVWQKEGWLIVAMELCDCSLHDRLQAARQQHLPGLLIKDLLKYMQQAAEGLDALNVKGVQHRDVKPRNLMLVGNGVKVADFGLAKVLDKSQGVHSGTMTVAYSAPESFKGTLAAQSDQYSLAITYYELRTGSVPFSGNQKEIMYAHLEKTPDLSPLPAQERPVLGRALAKEPKERWKNCKAFVNELIKAHQSRKTEPPPPPPKPKPEPDKIFDEETIPAPGPWQPPEQDPTIPGPLPPRGTGWLWPVLAALFLMALVSCGALSVGIGLFSGTPTTKPPNYPDKDIGASRDKDKPVNNTDVDLLVDLGDGVKMGFVLIDPKSKPKGGAFEMGDANGLSDEKPHSVRMVKPYYLGKYVVTQEQYKQVQVTGDNPSWFRQGGGGADIVGSLDTNKFPVEEVSWIDANAYCADLMKKHGAQLPAELRQKGYRFALPTEAQWEYACRAGTTTTYYFGNDAKNLGEYAWFLDNSGSRTHQVGTRKPNDWSLYDMHGNVWQWCQDWYGPYDGLPQEDPVQSVKQSEERRVLRGGSWSSNATRCRAACRDYDVAPAGSGSNGGFRVCVRLD